MKVMCMSFDGDSQLEKPSFESTDEAWEYANDLGCKWFFYPFCFVVTDSGKTVVDAPDMLDDIFNGRRVASVKRAMYALSRRPDMENADCDIFTAALLGV